METSKNVSINQLVPLLKKGETLGLKLGDVTQKVNDVLKNQSKGILQIVLLGSFSDGKTSTIAGLLGKKTSDMKIDQAESSDELTYYHLDGIDKNYVIVDTPGLFGTKEREVDGTNMKYSDITRKCISNANLLIYVCDAVNPIKESHIPSLRLVLRTFGKLDSTIFVLNKMDEAGVDMADDEEYEEMSEIKKANITKRLQDNFQLSNTEIKNLKIACIAADYKGKGFNYWSQHKDDYARLSHISELYNAVRTLVSSKDTEKLNKDTEKAVLTDSLLSLAKQINIAVKAVETPLKQSKELQADMVSDLKVLNRELMTEKGEMTKRLKDLQDGLLVDVNNCTDMRQLANIVETQIGVENKKVTAYIIQRDIQQILDDCSETNKATLQESSLQFGDKFDLQSKLLEGAVSKATSFLSSAKIDSSMVFQVRDMLFQSYKFKPWGAINLAANITKWMRGVGFVLSVLAEMWQWVNAKRNEKKVAKSKEDIKNAVKELIKQIYAYFDNDEAYYKNFAPSYLEMSKKIHDRQTFLNSLEERIALLKDYKNLVSQTMGVEMDNIEDAEYEEL